MLANIVVPIDLEHEGCWEAALEQAAVFACDHGAVLHLVTVIHSGPSVLAQYFPGGYEQTAGKSVEAVLETLGQGLGLEESKVTTAVRFGSVYPEILALAESVDADLIVVGSHRPEVTDYLLGSNAARVVRHAKCSV